MHDLFLQQFTMTCDLKAKIKLENSFKSLGINSSSLSNIYKQTKNIRDYIKKIPDILKKLNFTSSLDAVSRLYADYCHIMNTTFERISNECRLGKMSLQDYLQHIADVDYSSFEAHERSEFDSKIINSLKTIFRDRCRNLKDSAVDAEHLREIFKNEENSYKAVKTVLNKLYVPGIVAMCEIYYNKITNYWTKVNCATAETQIKFVEQYFKKIYRGGLYKGTNIMFEMGSNVVACLLPSPRPQWYPIMLRSIKQRRSAAHMLQGLESSLKAKIAARNSAKNSDEAHRLSSQLELHIKDMIEKIDKISRATNTFFDLNFYSNNENDYEYAYYKRLIEKKMLLYKILREERNSRAQLFKGSFYSYKWISYRWMGYKWD